MIIHYHNATPIDFMPTKRPRNIEYAENLPANLKTEDVCPTVFTGQQLFDKRPKDYAKVVQMLAQGATIKQDKQDLKGIASYSCNRSIP